jgi:prepilin-type processing-associated H-X9-DG protein/prepilin-type N-terminal cleavage/methylation domain-containing protein
MVRKTAFTLVELLIVVTLVGILVFIAIPALARARDALQRSNCESNFRAIGLALRMYASENKEVFPRVHGDQPFGKAANAGGCDPKSFQSLPAYCPQVEEIFPEYLADLNHLICPASKSGSNPNPLLIVRRLPGENCAYEGAVTRGDFSYTYLGYILDRVDDETLRVNTPVEGPAQLVALAQVMAKVLADENPDNDQILNEKILLSDVGMEGHGYADHASMAMFGDECISRLRYWITRRMVTDFRDPYVCGPLTDEVPMMWDTGGFRPDKPYPSSHLGGCNVLYLDGHVEFVNTGEKFPATSESLFSDIR